MAPFRPPARRPFTLLLTAITALAVPLVTAAVPAAAAGPPGAVLYVSPTGDDHAPGTSGRPFRTLTHARDAVRSLDQDMKADITVRLLPGTYRLTEPLTLDSRDSGTNGHEVIWTAASGAHPVVSGGRRLTGWKLTDRARNLWSAPAPAGLNIRQLYADGARARRAAGPLPTQLTATDTGYTAASDAMASWRNPKDIEFVYSGGDGYWSLKTGGQGGWTEPRCPVGSVSGTTITMAQPCWDNSNKRVMRTDNSGRTVNLVGPQSLGNGKVPAYVENAYEVLDQPGEWYLDRSAGTVYYIPRRGEDPRRADIEAPTLEKLVDAKGTASAPIHDVAFTGVQFSYATWLTPSTPEGFSEIQANYTVTGPTGYATQGLCQFIAGGTCPYGAWTKTPGNVSLAYDQRVRFEGDVFAHLGAAGLDLGDGSQDATVKGCVFTDISGNGLEVGGVDMPQPAGQADHTSGVQVLDNHLYGLPAEYHGGVAVDVGYAEHTLISRNQIDHTSYTAISMGWGGWPDKIAVQATPNYSNDNTISANLIRDPMQLLADGGAIYTQGITGTSLADGEHVTGNVILNSLGHGHAIYSDNGATFMTINGNVLYGNENDWGGTHTDYRPGASGSDPTDIEGNYWQQGDADTNAKNIIKKDNHLIAGLSDVPADVLGNAGLEPAYRHLLAVTPGGTTVPDAPAQVAAFAADGAAYVGWNPVFVDHGSPVLRYTVTASPGGKSVTVSAAGLRRLGYAAVPGLTNGTAYTFTVTATNGHGMSETSLPSAAVTPKSGVGAVPGAPTSFASNTDGGTVRLSWNPPSSAGGTPILGYTISAPGLKPVHYTGHTAIWATSGRNIFTTIGGLKKLRPYTFQITADNLAGSGKPAVLTAVPDTVPACSGAKLTIASDTAEPGKPTAATTTLTDGCDAPLSGAKVYLSATNGYQVSPASPADLGDVAAGASAVQKWTVTPPADATSGSRLTAVAVFTTGGTAESVQATGAVTPPAPSLQAAYDNVGISDDASPTAANIDGAGSSFSAQALAAAGATPGGTVTAGGATFTWPNVAAGQNDNAVASGTAFGMSGSGGTLSFLLTSAYGPSTGTGQVIYSDGTSDSFTLTVPDWHSGCSSSGAGVALYMPYRNRPNGKDSLPVCVFDASTPLQPGKTVTRIVLPNGSGSVTSGVPSLHIFAATIH